MKDGVITTGSKAPSDLFKFCQLMECFNLATEFDLNTVACISPPVIRKYP
jgi:hypothetical protein